MIQLEIVPTSPVPQPLRYQLGVNSSGLHPLGRAVLVLPIEKGLRTDKLILPDAIRARSLVQDTEAYVVEIGPTCDQDEGGVRCKVGDRVVIAMMSGAMHIGNDGQTYRSINHRDIYMIRDEEPSYE